MEEAPKDILPSRILKKRNHSLSVPVNRCFQGNLPSYLRDTLTSTQARNSVYIKPPYVGTMITEHTEGKRNWDVQLGLLLSFALWAQPYLDDLSTPKGRTLPGRFTQDPCLVKLESVPT